MEPSNSGKRIRQSLAEIQPLVSGESLSRLRGVSRDPAEWDRMARDPERLLQELPQSQNLNITPRPVGPALSGPGGLPNRCFQICRTLGPADPRDDDPNRIRICVASCLPGRFGGPAIPLHPAAGQSRSNSLQSLGGEVGQGVHRKRRARPASSLPFGAINRSLAREKINCGNNRQQGQMESHRDQFGEGTEVFIRSDRSMEGLVHRL